MSALFLMLVSSVVALVSSDCLMGSFDFEFKGSCNYENVLAHFEPIFNDPINTPEDCSKTAQDEFWFLLKAADADSAVEKVKDICRKAIKNLDARLPLENVPANGIEFIEQYYNGATYLNEEHETNYPKTEGGKPTNVLKIDFQRAKQVYNSEGRYGIIDWPGELSNFNLDSCKMNAAKCCFAQDRQANDNNGNCATPYDQNCEDKDPADNANLCHVDLERGVNSTGYEGTGTMIFPYDNSKGEGPIHCHGFAWANDDTDYTNYYKGNNLFYVSMYDHLYQRGYVRNFPGAPMCACLEQTPVTDRADCTEIDVKQENFMITYDGENWDGKMTYARIAFASCQGYGRDGNRNNGNDLWPHMHRLYVQGKLTLDQIRAASKVLVSDEPDTCNLATKRELEKSEGLVIGYNHDPNTWVQIIGKNNLEMTEAFGGISFNDLLYNSPNGIYRRVCASCDVRAQHIYIKRLNKENMPKNHLYYILTGNKKLDPGYVHGVDFELYPTYEDAKSGTNKFVCNYNYGDYFPGQCSPDGERLDYQYSRFYSSWGKSNVAFYVEKGVDSPDIDILRSTTINDIDFEANVFGENKFPGSVRSDGNGTYYITNSGRDLWSYSDYTYLHSSEPVEGDLDISVKIGDVDDKSYWTKSGILIRETLEPKARTVFAYINQPRYTNVQWKTKSSGMRWSHTMNNKATSHLRLTRVGNLFSVFFKENDSDDWVYFYQVTVEMNPSVYIGIGFVAHNNNNLAEAKFTDFSFQRSVSEIEASD